MSTHGSPFYSYRTIGLLHHTCDCTDTLSITVLWICTQTSRTDPMSSTSLTSSVVLGVYPKFHLLILVWEKTSWFHHTNTDYLGFLKSNLRPTVQSFGNFVRSIFTYLSILVRCHHLDGSSCTNFYESSYLFTLTSDWLTIFLLNSYGESKN